MKKLALVLMAVGMFGVMPALAADHGGMKMDTKEGVRQCALQAESLQQKIKRLQAEVKKGNKNYSAEELKNLEDKLKEANKIVEDLTKNP